MKRPFHPAVLAAARALTALLSIATTIYAILTYSPFAYEQFIQPNMIAWLSNFVLLHTDFYWLSLCVTLLTLAPHLRGSRWSGLAWAYLIAGTAAGVVMTFATVLPRGNASAQSVAVALLALVPMAWLGVIDSVTASGHPRREPRFDVPAFAATVAAAAAVWAVFALAAPMRLRSAGGVDAANAVPQLIVGATASLSSHLTAFTLLFLVFAAAGSARVPGSVVGGLLLGVAVHEIVLVPISVGGPVAWVLALAIAGATAASIRGVARQFGGRMTARAAVAVALAFVVICAFGVLPIVTSFDWGFMLQKLAALAAASAAYAAAGFASDAAPRGNRPVAPVMAVMAVYGGVVVALPRLPAWFNDARFRPDFALDAYSAADPAFRLLHQFLDSDQARSDDAPFYAFLRANSSIGDPLPPVDVDFAELGSPLERPPNIFFFVIDSLRRDYVSPYNARVTFTPRLAEFAADSDVFTRAFTRYGGTGLAVPAIWAGALVAHKQYVTPFAPMNALAKLLDAGRYRRFVTKDHITDELFGLEPTDVLDAHVEEMSHTFCGTMAELKDDLRQHVGDGRPVFAHTRPLDLHIGNTRFASVPAGETYPGFFEPYAARVHRIDACFGDFVDELKRLHLYDESVIVVMADHGDSLGEGLRWGHGYTIVPEVLRIPLLVHVPTALRTRYVTDATQIAMSTDVTPSLYQLAGRDPVAHRIEQGASLYHDARQPFESRRREDFLVVSSYGPVYGIVAANGRRLYIADAVEGRDSMYDLSPSGGDGRIGMTDAERQAYRAQIRAQVADLGAWYRVPASHQP